MSSASAINPTHVASLQSANNAAAAAVNHPHDEDEWPALSPTTAIARPTVSDNVDSDDWELLPEQQEGDEAITRSPTVVRIVEPEGNKGLPVNLKQLKHCSSSPDLRHLVLEDESSSSGSSSGSSSSHSGDDSSAVLVDSNDVTSVASSSVVVVQASAKAAWGGGVSFKDTLMKNGAEEKPKAEHQHRHHHHHHKHHKKRVKKQPTFVVKPISRSAKSTGDLQRLELIAENGGDVLGDSDAALFYGQKEHGKISVTNSRKLRMDEKKRIDMIKNKKDNQRRAQGIYVPPRQD